MGFLPYTTTLLRMAGGAKYLVQGRIPNPQDIASMIVISLKFCCF